MKRRIEIEYSWECKSFPFGIPEPLASALEGSAQERIFGQIQEGFNSGELCDCVDMDVPGHGVPMGGYQKRA